MSGGREGTKTNNSAMLTVTKETIISGLILMLCSLIYIKMLCYPSGEIIQRRRSRIILSYSIRLDNNMFI